jgi:hypothetical protein
MPENHLKDRPEKKLDYNARVKERLIAWRDAFEEANCGAKLNYSAIADKMKHDFDITTSPQKISAMFDSQSQREVKLQEVAALCQIFNIPMQSICEYPKAPVSDMERLSLVKRKNAKQEGIRHLNNAFYEGQYYCYYFRPKHFHDKLKPVEESILEEAMLDIRIKHGNTVVTLTEMKVGKTFTGDKVPQSFVLTGNLYHFENTDMAYSFLTDETGRRAMALMFTYLNLCADIRFYITVGMMTFATNQTHVPLFQKMAVFRVRQKVHEDPKQAELVRGILALNTCPIVLDEETMDRLVAEDEDLASLIAREKALKKCYVFSEAAIRSGCFFIQDDDVKMQKLLKLRRNSLYPAHEIVSEPDYFADFIKHYQQSQLLQESGGEEELL